MRKLRQIRKERKLTLKELEAISGVDYSSISRIEQGEYLPKLETLLKLARALEVSITELLDEELEPVK